MITVGMLKHLLYGVPDDWRLYLNHVNGLEIWTPDAEGGGETAAGIIDFDSEKLTIGFKVIQEVVIGS